MMFKSSRNHKQYLSFMEFIKTIRSGKTAIIFAPDYVVIDRKSYDELIMRFEEPEFKFLYYDEMKEVSTEQFNWIRELFLKRKNE